MTQLDIFEFIDETKNSKNKSEFNELALNLDFIDELDLQRNHKKIPEFNN